MCANINDTRGEHVLAYKGEAALSTNQQLAVYLAPPLTHHPAVLTIQLKNRCSNVDNHAIRAFIHWSYPKIAQFKLIAMFGKLTCITGAQIQMFRPINWA